MTISSRRRVRLLRYLACAQCRAEGRLVREFGTNVYKLLRDLFLANLVEPSAGERVRWRLTAAGRTAARRFLSPRARAA